MSQPASLSPAAFQRLSKLLSCSTAPFREHHVIREIEAQLGSAKIPWFVDEHGNRVVGVDSAREYQTLLKQRNEEPVRVFIAHMDHPGFHGVKWLSARRLSVRWYGGSPVRHLAGSRVWLATEESDIGQGRLGKVTLNSGRYGIASAEVTLDKDCSSAREVAAKNLYGGLAFRAPLWKQGQRLYTRAADDLAGVFAILETARSLQAQRRRGEDVPFIGLLTRGEEVGFVGAVKHLEAGYLAKARRPLMVVSLEASRTLPGAIIGKGPVVRLGDRRTVFDAGGLQVLTQLAERLLPGTHQRRIMDGGACEATAATAWGLPTVGISIPLGNYHNEGYEGGVDCEKPRGPAPEFVHLSDIAGELKLCKGLMKKNLPWADPWKQTRQRLEKNARRYKMD
jgi:putative aminopeptidase FrvX